MVYFGEIGKDLEILSGDKDILIYGAGKFGKKVYRCLLFYGVSKRVKAFIETFSLQERNSLYDVPIINLEIATELYKDSLVCIGGRHADEMRNLLKTHKIKNIHEIDFNIECERWGTEYGGFYIPCNCQLPAHFLVYSFGIGEDLSFSEAVINKGGRYMHLILHPRQ